MYLFLYAFPPEGEYGYMTKPSLGFSVQRLHVLMVRNRDFFCSPAMKNWGDSLNDVY